MKDGIPINPANGTHLVYGHHISVNGLKQIEVVYGPASALYGADAFAGIINLISKTPKGRKDIEANLSIGNNDSLDGYLLAGTKRDQSFVEVYGHGYRTTGFDMRKEYRHYRIHDTTGQLTPIYDPGKPFEAPTQDWDTEFKAKLGNFDLEAIYLDTRQPNNIQTPYYTGRSQLKKDKAEIGTLCLALSHDREIPWRLTLKSTFDGQLYELDPHSDYGRYTFDNYIYERSLSGKLGEQLTWTGERGTVIGGFNLERVETFPYINSKRPFHGGDTFRDFPVKQVITSTGKVLTIRPVREFSYWVYGLYLQATRSVSEKINLTLGARYDWDTYNHQNSFNPRAGLVYRLAQGRHIKLMYGTAYISPSPYFNCKAWAENGYAHLPPGLFQKKLEPERLQSIEMAYTDNGIGYAMTVSVYFTEARNLLQEGYKRIYGNTFVLRNGSIVDDAVVELPGNSGLQRNFGIDFLLKKNLFRDWRLSIRYSFLNARKRLHRHLFDAPKVSRHKAGASISGTIWSHVLLNLRGRWWSGIHTMPSNPEYRGRKLKAHAVFDLNIRCIDLPHDLELDLTINNLFDEHYCTAGNETEDQTTGASLPFVPQDPRRFLLGLSYRF